MWSIGFSLIAFLLSYMLKANSDHFKLDLSCIDGRFSMDARIFLRDECLSISVLKLIDNS